MEVFHAGRIIELCHVSNYPEGKNDHMPQRYSNCVMGYDMGYKMIWAIK